jgi:plastocyanin
MISVRRVVGLGLLAVALVGCGGAPSASKSAQGGAVPRASSPSPPAGELVQIGQVTYANWGERNVVGDTTLNLDAGDFYFSGTFIWGLPGQTLTLQIKNVAPQLHNISIPAQRVDRVIPAGSSRVNVEVTFPDSGSVQFFCKYYTARGMNGLLLVGDVPPRSAVIPSPVPSPAPAR